jgi:rod shape-determining protein MreD
VKRFLFFVGLAILAIIIETTLLPTFPSRAVRCDAVWLTILFIGFYHEFWEGLPSVLLIGYIMDCVASPFLGLMMTTYLIVFITLRLLTAQIYVETLVSKVFWVFIMTLIGKYSEYILLIWLDVPVSIYPVSIMNVVIQGLWNGVLAIPFFPLIKHMMSWLYKKDYVYTVSTRQYS